MNQTSATPRRKFDDSFRREAVHHSFSSAKSAGVIAGELGINSNQIYAWRKRFAPADAGGRAVLDDCVT